MFKEKPIQNNKKQKFSNTFADMGIIEFVPFIRYTILCICNVMATYGS